MRGKLFFDGGCRPSNPGPAGFACVIQMENGDEYTLARHIGFKTNNEAEYYGLIVGVKYAAECGATELEIFTDSKLVEGQINQGWKRKDFKMKCLAAEAEDVLRKHFEDSWELNWHRRENNSLADELCTKAILAGQLANPFVRKTAVTAADIRSMDPFSRPST